MGAFFAAFRSKRVGLLIALGFASGLPFSMRGSTLAAWMTNAGVDLKTIGIFGAMGLIYSLKVLWAPLVDRYAPPWLGRRRGWMVAMQILLAMGIAAMGAIDPKAAPVALAAMAVTVTFLAATQDIAVDAYRADVLPERERASGTATFVMGYRIGMQVAGALALFLSGFVSWPTVYCFVASLMIAGMVATWVAPEPEVTRPPRTLGEAVVKPFMDYFTRSGALVALAIILLYKFGDYLAAELVIPFLIKTGFSNPEIAVVQKTGGMFATVFGTLLGGGLVPKLGLKRALLTFGVLQAVANTGYLALAMIGKSHGLLVAAIAVDFFCMGLGQVALSAYILSLCNKSFSATQYALLSSAAALLGRLFGASSGYIAEGLGWPGFFAVTMVLAIPGLVVIALVRPEAAEARRQENAAPA